MRIVLFLIATGVMVGFTMKKVIRFSMVDGCKLKLIEELTNNLTGTKLNSYMPIVWFAIAISALIDIVYLALLISVVGATSLTIPFSALMLISLAVECVYFFIKLRDNRSALKISISIVEHDYSGSKVFLSVMKMLLMIFFVFQI